MVRDLEVKAWIHAIFIFFPFQNLFVFASLKAMHLLVTLNHISFSKRKAKYEKNSN